MFDAKVLIKRLSSFSVPKITVIWHVKPILKFINSDRPEQAYEKPLVPLMHVGSIYIEDILKLLLFNNTPNISKKPFSVLRGW